MSYLVVGGSGFIGVNLTDHLLRGERSVRVYDRSANRFRGLSTGVEYVPGELGNHGLIREAVAGMEVVFHLVSTTLPKTANDDPIYDVRSNLVDTLQLLEACVEAGVRKVVFASSGGTVYGVPRSVPIDEGHPTDPLTSYGIVKLAIEKYLALFKHLHGLDYAALRISNPYGPYQDPAGQQGAIGVFLRQIFLDRPITIWGDGSVVRDYLYATDLVGAMSLAANSQSGGVLNVGSGIGISLNELLEAMAGVVGERPEVRYLPGRALDVPANVLDTSRVREELGWEPVTDLTAGMKKTWAWIQTLDERKELPE